MVVEAHFPLGTVPSMKVLAVGARRGSPTSVTPGSDAWRVRHVVGVTTAYRWKPARSFSWLRR